MKLSHLGILSFLIILSVAFVGCAPSSSQKTASAAVPAHKQYWTCSMHPQLRLEHPGKCPICGMNLVPVIETAEASQSASAENPLVKLTSAQNSVASIASAPVKKDFLTSSLSLFGEVAYIPDSHVSLTWVYSGRVEKVLIPYSSTEVKKGQGLVEVYSQEAIADQQAYLAAARESYTAVLGYTKKTAAGVLQSYREKLLHAGMTSEELNALIHENRIKTSFTLTAPVTGSFVGALPLVGEQFSADKPFFHIAPLDEVWFVAKAYEQDVPFLSVGQSVTLNLSSLIKSSGSTAKAEGKIISISRFLDSASRTVELRVLLANPQHVLLPGMVGTATISSTTAQQVLIIPSSAVIDTGKRKVVYVKAPSATYLQQEIVTGRENDTAVEVVSGLNQGEEVVSSGAFLIDAEAQLKK